MNSAVEKRKWNIQFFFIMLVTSLALIASSGYFLRHALTTDNTGLDKSTSACLAALRSSGFNPMPFIEDKRYRVIVTTTSDYEKLIYKSAVQLARCPTFTVEEYCAGQGCMPSGIQFTITKKIQ